MVGSEEESSSVLAIILFVLLTIMFLFCIFMTVLCYGTSYSKCYCCIPPRTQTVLYVTGGGNVSGYPQVVMMPAQPMQAYVQQPSS